MAPKATGEFLSEAAPSTQFLPTFPKAFHLYPLETAPHSLNSPSRGKKVKRRRRRGNRALTHFVMPFDHTFIYKTDGCPLSCLYQCVLIFWKKGVQRLGLAYLESQILGEKKSSPILSSTKRKLNRLPSPMISMSSVKCFPQKVKDNFHSHEKIIYTCSSITIAGELAEATGGISTRSQLRQRFSGNMRDHAKEEL